MAGSHVIALADLSSCALCTYLAGSLQLPACTCQSTMSLYSSKLATLCGYMQAGTKTQLSSHSQRHRCAANPIVRSFMHPDCPLTLQLKHTLLHCCLHGTLDSSAVDVCLGLNFAIQLQPFSNQCPHGSKQFICIMGTSDTQLHHAAGSGTFGKVYPALQCLEVVTQSCAMLQASRVLVQKSLAPKTSWSTADA